MDTEILSEEELADMTGYKARGWQIRWLKEREWHFVESRGRRPLVGRQYARIKLGLAAPTTTAAPPTPKPAWTPDFSGLR